MYAVCADSNPGGSRDLLKGKRKREGRRPTRMADVTDLCLHPPCWWYSNSEIDQQSSANMAMTVITGAYNVLK